MAPRRKTLSDRGVAELKAKVLSLRSSQIQSFVGTTFGSNPPVPRPYVVVARGPSGKQVWATIGDVGGARHRRRRARRLARPSSHHQGRRQTAPGPRATARPSPTSGFRRHVEQEDGRLRSAPNIRCYLDRHILPAWKDRDFKSIKRSDLAKLLDHIEDTAGAVAADQVLSVVSSISNWYAARDDNYMSPVVRGMRRSQPKERARIESSMTTRFAPCGRQPKRMAPSAPSSVSPCSPASAKTRSSR